ncbi:MAG: hypothetical protein GY759_01680 [Chloroflexi bacterium]|nr:hypothetical protein [Chloroflexota bacterium]
MKHLTRTLIPLALILGLFVGLAPRTASAAEITDDYSVACKDGVCSLTIDLNDEDKAAESGRISFSLPKQLGVIPAGTSFEISDSVSVSLPVGDIDMVDTDLSLGLNDDNNVEALRGTARVPFSDLELFDDIAIDGPTLIDVGIDRGENLTDLNIPLNPDHTYMFFELDAGFAMDAQQNEQHFKLSVPPGQHATLVLDTQEPQLYVSGGVNLSHNGELTFLSPILSAGALPLGLDVLPIGQHATLQVSGSVGKQMDETFLQMSGGVAVDEGKLGEWIGIEATPLAVEGLVSVNPDGLLMTGVTSTSLQPNLLFSGDVQAQAFIPFHDVLDNGYAQIDVNATIPLAKIDANTSARLDKEDVAVVKNTVENQLSAWTNAIQPVGPYLATMANKASNGASSGYRLLEQASKGSYNWLTTGATDAYQSVVTQLPAQGS